MNLNINLKWVFIGLTIYLVSILSGAAVIVEVPKSAVSMEDSDFKKYKRPANSIEFSHSDFALKGITEPSLIAKTGDIQRNSIGKVSATLWREILSSHNQYFGLGFAYTGLTRDANLAIGQAGFVQISQDLQFYQLKMSWRYKTEKEILKLHPFIEFAFLPSLISASSSQFNNGITDTFMSYGATVGLFLDLDVVHFLIGFDRIYSTGSQKISDSGLFTGVNFDVDLL